MSKPLDSITTNYVPKTRHFIIHKVIGNETKYFIDKISK